MGIAVVSNLTSIVAPSGWTGGDNVSVGPNAFSLCFWGFWSRVCDGTEVFPQTWTVGDKHAFWYWEWSGATSLESAAHATGLNVSAINAPLPSAVTLGDLIYVLYASPNVTTFTLPAALLAALLTGHDLAFQVSSSLGISAGAAGATTAALYAASLSTSANAIGAQLAIKGTAMSVVAGASIASA